MCQSGHLRDYRPLQWEKIGEVVKCPKLSVPRDCEPLWWEKIGKVVKCANLAVSSDFRPLW